ncbi:hypothetical protein J31TS6_19270 [Brevibacillus reuszeri]|nr:hypothetical protein J31TS6_19270 [Brevibacillus reuszeri]
MAGIIQLISPISVEPPDVVQDSMLSSPISPEMFPVNRAVMPGLVFRGR